MEQRCDVRMGHQLLTERELARVGKYKTAQRNGFVSTELTCIDTTTTHCFGSTETEEPEVSSLPCSNDICALSKDPSCKSCQASGMKEAPDNHHNDDYEDPR